MNKKDIIMQIRSARASHIRWKSYVEITLRGIILNTTEENLPIVQTECDFGKWYYGDGMNLSSSVNYQNLEYPHEMIHEIYIQIFTLQKAKLRGGFFITKKRLLRKKKAEIDRLHQSFNDFSKILVETLKQLEMEVLSMSDAQIREMFNIEKNDDSFARNDDGFDLFVTKID